MTWAPPDIQVRWGSYFKVDPQEQQQQVQTVQEALGKSGGEPLITTRKAVEKIAAIFQIDSVDELLEQLEEERDARAERAMEQARAEASSLHGLMNGTGAAEGGDGAGGRGNAAPERGRRVGGAAAPAPGRKPKPGDE